MDKEVVVSTITGITAIVGTILTGVFAIKLKKSTESVKNLVKSKEKDIQRIHSELRFTNIFFSYEFLSVVNNRVADIYATTKANRFLILYAINGKDDFNVVTACYENPKQESSRGAMNRYIKIEIDNPYREMLKDCELKKSVTLDVSLMNTSILKSIYQSEIEDVKHSVIKFITRLRIDSENHAVVFCSISTTTDTPFTDSEMYVLKYNADALRAKASHIIIG